MKAATQISIQAALLIPALIGLSACAPNPYGNFLSSVRANSTLASLYSDEVLSAAGAKFCSELEAGTGLSVAASHIDGPPIQGKEGGYPISRNSEVVRAVQQAAGWNIDNKCTQAFQNAGGQAGR